MITLSRRSLLGMAGALIAAPRLGAAPPSTDRKLLVVLCQGGWDPTRLFNPAFGNTRVSMEADAEPWTVGGFLLVDSPARPGVREWFTRWHDQAAIIDGIEVRSITHERCLRLLLSDDRDDDWLAVLAGNTRVERALPHLVLSGPAYTTRYTGGVVRIGADGQLPDLLSGAALGRADPTLRGLSTASRTRVETLLRARVAHADPAFAASYGRALDDLDDLRSGDIDLYGRATSELCGGVAGEIGLALDAFATDRARCALIQYGGNCGPNWDQHADIAHQSASFEELFAHLTLLMEGLESRAGVAAPTLLDEVTVLVCSEMGRHPQVNVQGGKDHWTYTSCLLFGAGVRGDVHVGGYDDDTFGRPVDLATGAAAESGTALLPGHLGATLYALGGLDPAEHVDAAPITAVLA